MIGCVSAHSSVWMITLLCTTIEEIAITGRVAVIGADSFRDCENLARVKLEQESSLRRIETSAFCGCVSLQEMRIPASLEVIGSKAFMRCKCLVLIDFDPNIVEIAEDAFQGVNM